MYGDLKIFNLDSVINSGIRVPEMIDFDHLGLYKKKSVSKGVVNSVEYYKYKNGKSFEDLIVVTDFLYVFEPPGIYTGMTTRIKWIDYQESIGYQNEFFKEFLAWEIIEFGIQKRQNILAEAKMFCLQTFGIVNGYDLLTTLTDQVDSYINGVSTPLLTTINLLVKPYLTTEIKTDLLNILSNIN